MTFRVELGAGAQAQFQPPGRDSRFRETLFGAGRGILGFYLDQEAQLIRIFDIIWVG